MKYEEVIVEQMKKNSLANLKKGNVLPTRPNEPLGETTTKRKELAKIAGTSEGSIQRSKLILEKGTPVKAICYLAKKIKERGINMTFGEWKEIRKINGEDAKKIIRNFELNNPELAASYEKRHEKELSEMRDIAKIPDRMERWKAIAKSAYAYDPTFEQRRQREVM